MYIRLGSLGFVSVDAFDATAVRKRLSCKFNANELNHNKLSRWKFICTGLTWMYAFDGGTKHKMWQLKEKSENFTDLYKCGTYVETQNRRENKNMWTPNEQLTFQQEMNNDPYHLQFKKKTQNLLLVWILLFDIRMYRKETNRTNERTNLRKNNYMYCMYINIVCMQCSAIWFKMAMAYI